MHVWGVFTAIMLANYEVKKISKNIKEYKAPLYVSMHTALWCIGVCTPATSQIITVPEQAPCQWQWHHPPKNTDWHSQLASFCVGMCDRAATFTPSDDLRLTAVKAWITSGYRGFLERAVKGPVPFPANFFLPLYKRKIHSSQLKMRIVQKVPQICLELVLCLKVQVHSYSKSLPKCFIARQRSKVNWRKTVSPTLLENNTTWHSRQK